MPTPDASQNTKKIRHETDSKLVNTSKRNFFTYQNFPTRIPNSIPNFLPNIRKQYNSNTNRYISFLLANYDMNVSVFSIVNSKTDSVGQNSITDTQSRSQPAYLNIGIATVNDVKYNSNNSDIISTTVDAKGNKLLNSSIYSNTIYNSNPFNDNSQLVFLESTGSGFVTPLISGIQSIELVFKFNHLRASRGISLYLMDMRTASQTDKDYWIVSTTDTITSFLGNSTLYLNGVNRGKSNTINIGSLINNTSWNHLVLTFDTPFESEITFFSRYTFNQSMEVSINKVSLYNRQLTSSEITTFYNTANARFV